LLLEKLLLLLFGKALLLLLLWPLTLIQQPLLPLLSYASISPSPLLLL
jgi:hypothetical protein